MTASQPATTGAGRAAYLAYLAENTLSEEAVLPVLPEVDEATRKKVAEILRAAEQAGHAELVERFNRGASGNTNLLLEELHNRLTARLVKAGFPLRSQSFAGVYPTNSLNAHVVKRSGVDVILVNTGTFEIIGPIASLLCSLEPGNARTHARKAAGLLKAYCNAGRLPSTADLQDLRPSGDQMTLAVHLTTSVEEFILAHEYGHLANGDIGETVVELTSPDGRSTTVAAKSIEQEFAADLWASHAVTQGSWNGAGEEERLIKCSGPFMFLSIARLIEAHFAAKGFRSDTHPPAADRYIELLNAFAKAGMYRYTELALTFDQFCWLVAEELGVTVDRRESQLLVIGHVASLVEQGLQDAVPIPSQRSGVYQSPNTAERTTKPQPWWKFW